MSSAAPRAALFAVIVAIPGIARADVTVIYAPASSSPPPLTARTVEPWEVETGGGVAEGSAPPEVAARAEPIAPREVARAEPIAPGEPAVPVVTASVPACITPRPAILVRGATERASLPLTDCAGRPDPASLVELSILARPSALATRPSSRELAERAEDPQWVAGGIQRLHPGLLERLRVIADRFPGHAIEIVSGSRPEATRASRHAHGLAIDVRVQGTSLDVVYALVSRFDRTGIGLHREAGIVHLDVRHRRVRWIDEAAAGEPPRIVIDDERRAPLVRRAEPVPAPSPPPSTAGTSPTTLAPPTPRVDAIDAVDAVDAGIDPIDALDHDEEGEIDPDAIADEVLRGLRGARLGLPSR